MFLTAPALTSIPTITHGFFTRKGGVSDGIYASLNCGMGSDDVRENVIENRKRVADSLKAKYLCSLYQVHSADVVVVDTPWRHSKLPKADAMVTKQRGIALGILTADCAPVLFADKDAGVIGAAHSGWKGAIGGVLEATIAAMEALGGQRSNIVAAIGPAIAQKSYEVGAEFQEKFIQKNKDNARYFTAGVRAEHMLFDLKAFVKDTLAEAGLSAINMLENDTYLEEDAFFSFRRATHRGEPNYGRQISAIMLK
jgi:YfiH family protein